MLIGPSRKTLESIRVERRIEKNDRVLQQVFYLWTLGSRQIISTHQGRIGTAWLVAMNGMPNVHNRRHISDIDRRRLSRIGQLQVLLADRLQVLMVFWRSDDQQHLW